MQKINYNITNLKVAQLMIMSEVFNELVDRKITLKGKTLYGINKNKEKLQSAIFGLHMQREEIFRAHSDISEDGKQFLVREDERAKVNEEIHALAATEVPVDLHRMAISNLDEYELDLDLYNKMLYSGLFYDDVDTTEEKETSSEPELLLG